MISPLTTSPLSRRNGRGACRRRRLCRRDRALLAAMAICAVIAAVSHSVRRDYSILGRVVCGQADTPACAQR